MLTEFGKILRIIRMNSGDSAKNMAKKLYISTSYLYLIENGNRRIPEDMEISISKAYDLSNEEMEALHRAVMAERISQDKKIAAYSNKIDSDADVTSNTEKNGSKPAKAKKNVFKAILIIVVAVVLTIVLTAIILKNNKPSEGNVPITVNSTATENVIPEMPTEPTPAEMFEYDEKDGMIYITGYIGNDVSVLVPSEINGKRVYEIVEGAFAHNATLKHIAFSEGIKRIGFRICEDCQNLEYIKIPDSVYYIGNGLALSCEKLERVVIGDGATFMGEYCFDGCTNLKTIKIGEKISQIDHNAFSYCHSLEEIELPNSLTAIKYHAFYGCSELDFVEIPNGVTLIEDNAFCFCSNLKIIIVPPSVAKIGNNVFGECHKLTVYGESGSYIEQYCLKNGYCFKSLSKPTPAEMFEYEEHDNQIHITKYIGNDENIIVPNKIDDKPVSRIAERAFYGNKTVRSIIIQNGVEIIEFEAFARCTNLEHIQIPDSVTYLGNGAFIYCFSLKRVELGNGISTLGQCLFSFCYNLCKVKMGKFVSRIEHNAFSSCYSLENISLPDYLYEIEYAAFYKCNALEEVVLPNKLKIIGDNTFCECKNLKRLFIPSSVTKIGSELLMNCNDVTIYCSSGSYVEKYAIKNSYKYKTILSVNYIK